jgi:RNA polymerase sigma-70 factor (ECF subfamily)
MESVASGGAGALSRQEFEDFYNRTARALRAYIKRVAGNAAVADDILQESYVRLLNAPPHAEPMLQSYLYRTATNLIKDYYRAQSRQRHWRERALRQAESTDSNVELGQDIERLFLLVPVRERGLLWLAYVEQAEQREIAAILGLAEGSVRVLLHRARVKMEAILKAHGFEGP